MSITDDLIKKHGSVVNLQAAQKLRVFAIEEINTFSREVQFRMNVDYQWLFEAFTAYFKYYKEHHPGIDASVFETICKAYNHR